MAAWLKWPGTARQPHQEALQGALMAIGDTLIDVGLVDDDYKATANGAALLARVEAEERTSDPTPAIVAFIRHEERKFRDAAATTPDDSTHARHSARASVLATIGAYIERGDHLTTPIDASPAKEPR